MRKRLLVLHAMSPLGKEDATRIREVLETELTFVAWESQVSGGGAALDALAEVATVIRVPDPEQLVGTALEYAEHNSVHGVLASSDMLLAEGAEVAAKLGLPHNPIDVVPALLCKDIQRERLRGGGVPTPDWALLRTAADIPAALDTVALPAILKPVRGVGSMATFRIDEPGQLAEAFALGQQAFREAPPVPGTADTFLLEEFIGGDHPHPADPRLADILTVECLLFKGEIGHIVVGDKAPMPPPFRDAGPILPSSLPTEIHHEVLAVSERALRALGAYHGAHHLEIKLTAHGPQVIEVNGRNGFAMPIALQPHGYDYLTDIARVALGEPPLLPAGFSGFSVLRRGYTPPYAGELAGITGIEAARMLPGMLFLIPLMEPGQRPHPLRPGEAVAYLFCAKTRSLKSALDLVDRVSARVTIDYRPLETQPS